MKINKLLAAFMAATVVSGATASLPQYVTPYFASYAKDDEASRSGTLGDLTYSVWGDQVEITGCDQSIDGDIVVPDTIEGLPVTSIKGSAFANCIRLKTIKLPEGITDIGPRAFEGCSSMDKITLPEGLLNIENYAFSECSCLTLITLPDSLIKIAEGAFNRCGSLKVIDLPDGITSIEKGVFCDCKSLKTVYFPKELTVIKENAFIDCESLTAIKIPETIKDIQKGAFENCQGLTSVTIPESITAISDNLFRGCSSLESITLPDTLKSIGESAFYGTNISEITIPDSVEDIGGSAFGNCKSLTSITIPVGITEIKNSTFSKCTSLASVTLPVTVKSIGNYAFYQCSELEDITLPEGLKFIGSSAFYQADNFFEITIPDTVESIGNQAFFNDLILSITIPASVASIGKEAFAVNYYLESITILNPYCEIYDSAETICTSGSYEKSEFVSNGFKGTIYGYDGSTAQEYAEKYGYRFESIGATPDYTTGFYDDLAYRKYKDHVEIIKCSGFAEGEVVIPDRISGVPVTHIYRQAFDRSAKVTSVIIPDSVTNIGAYAFSKSGLTEITLPDSLTTIEYSAFNSCESLKSVTLPKSLKSVKDLAFYNCPKLTSINIPSSLREIGMDVFGQTPWLENQQKENPLVIVNNILIDGTACTGDVIVPKGVIRINDAAFYDATEIETLTMSDSVKSIGFCAFESSGLKSIVLPESVVSIEDRAFSACENLEDITILNPDCKIFNSMETIYNYNTSPTQIDFTFHGTILGCKDSTAQAYAEKFDRNFAVYEKAPDFMLGDINSDGAVDATDASDILAMYAKISTTNKAPTIEELNIFDVNRDGSVDASDASDILAYYAHTSTENDGLSFEDFMNSK